MVPVSFENMSQRVEIIMYMVYNHIIQKYYHANYSGYHSLKNADEYYFKKKL